MLALAFTNPVSAILVATAVICLGVAYLVVKIVTD